MLESYILDAALGPKCRHFLNPAFFGKRAQKVTNELAWFSLFAVERTELCDLTFALFPQHVFEWFRRLFRFETVQNRRQRIFIDFFRFL